MKAFWIKFQWKLQAVIILLFSGRFKLETFSTHYDDIPSWKPSFTMNYCGKDINQAYSKKKESGDLND